MEYYKYNIGERVILLDGIMIEEKIADEEGEERDTVAFTRKMCDLIGSSCEIISREFRFELPLYEVMFEDEETWYVHEEWITPAQTFLPNNKELDALFEEIGIV